MKILIEILPDFYERFVSKCQTDSREYSTLARGMVIRDQKSGEQRVIGILCDKVEAARLLYTATQLYPEAVHAIASAIDRAREL